MRVFTGDFTSWDITFNVITMRLREKVSMELILIDSGLVNKVGHSYKLAKTVSGALARRKLRYRIFGLSGLDTSIAAEIGAIPHFSRSHYECVEFSRNEKRLRSFAAMFRGAPAGGSPFSERQTWKAHGILHSTRPTV